MKVKIGDAVYTLNPAIKTLFQYISIFGESFLENSFEVQTNEKAILICLRLLYSGIEGRRPDYASFLKLADANLTEAAIAFENDVMRENDLYKKSNNSKYNSENQNGIAELNILAVCAICGIPEFVLNSFRIFDVLQIIKTVNMLKNPTINDPMYTPMDEATMNSIYGPVR